jgi:hypothetical protein
MLLPRHLTYPVDPICAALAHPGGVSALATPGNTKPSSTNAMPMIALFMRVIIVVPADNSLTRE